MSKRYGCSCGFIIAVEGKDSVKWLLCHPTNTGNRWDLPKGSSEENENHFDAAKRELLEETGLVFDDLNLIQLIDLGEHSYTNKKDLHLFYIEVDKLDVNNMHCISFVENKKGDDFPEMDAWHLFDISKVSSKIGKNLDIWFKCNIPFQLMKGYK